MAAIRRTVSGPSMVGLSDVSCDGDVFLNELVCVCVCDMRVSNAITIVTMIQHSVIVGRIASNSILDDDS